MRRSGAPSPAGGSSGGTTPGTRTPSRSPTPQRPARDPGLPGSPAQPFHTRLSVRLCQRSLRADALMLAATLAFIARIPPGAPPGTYTWAALFVAGLLAAMAFKHACRLGLGAAGRWRHCWRAYELLSLAVRTCDLGTGVCAAVHTSIVLDQTAQQQQQQQSAAAPGGDAGGDGDVGAALATALRLVFASSACNMALGIGILRLPPGLSAIAQLVIVRSYLPSLRGFCQPGGALAQPRLMRGARWAYRAVHAVMMGTAAPAWGSCTRADGNCAEPGVAAAAVECHALLTWLLLSLSLALPLLAETTSAARLFRQHDRQRAAAGVPPEAGPRAACYRGVAGLLLEDADNGGGGDGDGDGGYSTSSLLRIGGAAYLLLAAAWDASIWLAHRAAA